MRSWSKLIVAAAVLAVSGCAVQTSTVLEPPSPPVYGSPAPSAPGIKQPNAPVRPAPGMSYSYSDDSTGLPAADALLREGRSLHQRGQYANAANDFERAIRMAPRSPALYLALAKTRLALQDYGSAIQMANRALTLLPGDGWGVSDARADAWNVIAEAKEASGDLRGANLARQKARDY